MHYDKPATTVEQQLIKLQSRGLKCENKELALCWLKTVGYYRLSAYWLPLEEPVTSEGQTRSKVFKANASFADVIDTYVFDRKLRLLVTEAIERIEIALRSRWTNRFTLAYGPHGHLDPKNFRNGWAHARMIAQVADRANESRETFVVHYKQKYEHPYLPPLWMLTELMTFGQLSKWFEKTREIAIRKAVAKDMCLPSAETLEGTLEALCFVRNVSAHHGRLWNRLTVKRVPFVRKWKDDLVIEHGPQNQTSNRVYNILIALIRMLKHQSSDTTFPTRLAELIETRTDEQVKAMGFPDNWKQRPAWSGV